MILAAMQPYLFPYIGYIQLMFAADKLILHDGLRYTRQGYIHRNRYLEPGIGAMFFGADIRAGTKSGNISEVRVTDDGRWRERTLARLRNAYACAPFFNEVFPRVEHVLHLNTDRLATINASSLEMVRNYLDIECDLETTGEAYADLEASLAEADTACSLPGGLDRRNARIFWLCEANRASCFVNPIGGTMLYDTGGLAAQGVEMRYLVSDLPTYPQLHSREFVPSLSILDTLFHCSINHTRNLLSAYRLVVSKQSATA